MISFDEFKKLDLRIGKILKAERMEGSDKLLRLEVNLGSDPSTGSTDSTGSRRAGLPQAGSGQETRQIVAGIAGHYAPDALIGREIVVVVNLEPKTLKGIESQGMLLAASCNTEPVLLSPDRDVPPGSVVR